MLPGNPYKPLNAGVAPSKLRMKSSAICSSSPVDTPGCTAARSVSNVAARIFPPCAIRSISRADLSWITSRPLLAESAQRSPRHVVDRADGVDDRDRITVVHIPIQHGCGLLIIHAQARSHRVGIVIFAPNQRTATLAADAAHFATRVGCLTVLTHGSAAQPLDDFVVV